MRVSRLFVSSRLNCGQTLELDDDNAHYVRTVLRLKKDDPLVLFDDAGGEYSTVLLEVSRSRVLAHVNQWIQRTVESPLRIILGLGISRGDRMDWSVQKAVELGVNVIAPIVSERCVVQLKGEKRQLRLNHWQKIVEHAAEQCGRTHIPKLMPITFIHDWMNKQQGLKIFLDPNASSTLTGLIPELNQITLLTGPEGGFADHEREGAATAGFIPVRLGARTLRTETAVLAALSSVQMLWGDFGRQER